MPLENEKDKIEGRIIVVPGFLETRRLTQFVSSIHAAPSFLAGRRNERKFLFSPTFLPKQVLEAKGMVKEAELHYSNKTASLPAHVVQQLVSSSLGFVEWGDENPETGMMRARCEDTIALGRWLLCRFADCFS